MEKSIADTVLTGLKKHLGGNGGCTFCPYHAAIENTNCVEKLLSDAEKVLRLYKNWGEKIKFHDGDVEPTYEDVRANGTNEFLCVALRPAGGGKAHQQFVVLTWDECDAEWLCDEYIVKKWAYLPSYED